MRLRLLALGEALQLRAVHLVVYGRAGRGRGPRVERDAGGDERGGGEACGVELGAEEHCRGDHREHDFGGSGDRLEHRVEVLQEEARHEADRRHDRHDGEDRG